MSQTCYLSVFLLGVNKSNKSSTIFSFISLLQIKSASHWRIDILSKDFVSTHFQCFDRLSFVYLWIHAYGRVGPRNTTKNLRPFQQWSEFRNPLKFPKPIFVKGSKWPVRFFGSTKNSPILVKVSVKKITIFHLKLALRSDFAKWIPQLSYEKKTRPYFPWNTGCLIGIFIMV